MHRARLGILSFVVCCSLAVCLLSAPPSTAQTTPVSFTTTGALPAGAVGIPYGLILQITGGQAPYTFTITLGTVPAGLAFNGSTNGNIQAGYISGTPTAVGNNAFNVMVTDSLGSTATGSFSIAINAFPTSTAAQLALLSGPYAFLGRANQSDGSQNEIIGSLNFDGHGNLTVSFDQNGPGPNNGLYTQCTTSGTYSVGPDNRGIITLNSGNTCVTGGSGGSGTLLAMAIGDVKNGVASTARFIEFDNINGHSGLTEGLMRRQDPTTFNPTSLAGTYAVGETGQGTSFEPVVGLTLVTCDNNLGVPSVIADNNDNGTLNSGSATGTYTTPDTAIGRTVVTLQTIDGSTRVSAIYIVSANELFVLSLDSPATNKVTAGRGYRQFNPNSFGLTSLQGADVLSFSGTSGNGTSAGVGVLTADVVEGVGNFSIAADINDGGTLKLGQSNSGTYTVALNGRGTITGSSSGGGGVNLIMYLIGQDRALLIGEDSSDPPFGEIEPQFGGPPFSPAPFINSLFIGEGDLPPTATSDISGVAALVPPNTLNATIDNSKSDGELTYGQAISILYSVPSSGHFVVTGGEGTNLTGYVVSPYEVRFFDSTGPTSDPTPSVHPGLYIAQSIPQPPGVPSPPTTTVNFATSVPVGSNAQSAPITFTNSGVGPLTLQTLTNAADFSATGTCVATLPLPLILAPGGQTCQVVVTLAPTADTPLNTMLSETITIATDAGNIVITATGTAIAPGILINPVTVNFGNQLVDTPSPQMFVAVSNTGQVALTIATIVPGGANPGDFTQPAPNTTPPGPPCVNGIVLQPNGICALTFQFTPSAVGARSATITLTDDSPVAGTMQVITLNGTGTSPGVTLSANQINFGGVSPTTTSSAQTVTVSNSGTAAVHIATVTITGTNFANFTLVPTSTCLGGPTVQPGSSCSVSVTFTPPTNATFTATVNITDDAANSPQTIALSGVGSTLNLQPAPGTKPIVTVPPGSTVIFPLLLSGPPGTVVNLGCSSNQPTITCTISPLQLTLPLTGITQATINVITYCSWGVPRSDPPFRFPPVELRLLWLFVLAALSVLAVVSIKRRRIAFALPLALLLMGAALGCASPAKGPAGLTPQGTYQLTITATAPGGATTSIVLTLNVT